MPDTAVPRTVRRRRLAGGALVAVLAVVLVAVVVERSGGEKVVNAGGATKIMVGAKSTDAGSDELTGTLADVGGCLGVKPAAGGSDVARVVVWPHGTNVDHPDPLRVEIDDKVYAIGDPIRVGGRSSGALDQSSSFYGQVPKACRAAEGWVASER